jgi:small subunit ribosomal protein S7
VQPKANNLEVTKLNYRAKKEVVLGRRPLRMLITNNPKDMLYQSVWIVKLTNKLMKNGKKGRAEKQMLDFLTNLNQICRGHPHLIFHEVMEQLKPVLTTVVRRVGRRYYQVPVPVKALRQSAIVLG